MSDRFAIRYTESAVADIQSVRAYDQRRVLVAIETHLSNQPTRVSKSRIKRMTQPFWSQFRLRVDAFRVYYDVDEQQQTVSVLRVLEKGTASTPQEKE